MEYALKSGKRNFRKIAAAREYMDIAGLIWYICVNAAALGGMTPRSKIIGYVGVVDRLAF